VGHVTHFRGQRICHPYSIILIVPAVHSLSQTSTDKECNRAKAQKRPLHKDPSCPVKGMYRLLDLITEQGSSGLGNNFLLAMSFLTLMEFIVDKIVIAQESLQAFINALSPGSYSSITKVNFRILDNFLLKPIGVYGSKEEIVRFLREIRVVDDNAYVKLFGILFSQILEKSVRKLLTPQKRSTERGTEPTLRSGLFVVRSFVSTAEEQAYVLYWPEDTTWDDQAIPTVQSNRVMFMRYE